MRERTITFPQLMLVGVTRAMIGFGVGLLLAPRFVRDRRPAVGISVLSVGLLATIPLAVRILRSRQDAQQETRHPYEEPTYGVEATEYRAGQGGSYGVELDYEDYATSTSD